jgi:hypothetical protein
MKGDGRKETPVISSDDGRCLAKETREEEKIGSVNSLFLVQEFAALSRCIHAEYNEQAKDHKGKKDCFHKSLE